MAYDFSEKEMSMFKELGFELKSDDRILQTLPPFMIYNMAAKYCFLKKLEGKIVDSLRRCLLALDEEDQSKKIYRMTKEFDDLIQLGDENEQTS